jgi:hypothetical protein
VTDQSQSPELPDEQQAGDMPAALEPDAPAVAQPVIDAGAASPPEPPAAPESLPERPAPEPPAAWKPPYSAPGLTATETDTPAFESASATGADRPEIAVGAAFAAGFVLALILKRLGR